LLPYFFFWKRRTTNPLEHVLPRYITHISLIKLNFTACRPRRDLIAFLMGLTKTQALFWCNLQAAILTSRMKKVNFRKKSNVPQKDSSPNQTNQKPPMKKENYPSYAKINCVIEAALSNHSVCLLYSDEKSPRMLGWKNSNLLRPFGN